MKKIVSISALAAMFSSCGVLNELPTVSTYEAFNVTHNSAFVDAVLEDEGSSIVEEFGVCYSSTQQPSLDNGTCLSVAGGNLFTAQIENLNSNSTYFARAFATNGQGTAYGNQIQLQTATLSSSYLNGDLAYGTVTDQDGNQYATITIGSQEWMAENLRTDTYSNGDPIQNVVDQADWFNLTNGAWSHFDNDPVNEDVYGKLYNWFVVNDPRNVCPVGWHVPTDAEWTELTNQLGGSLIAGVKMKSGGYEYWTQAGGSVGIATNVSGFSGLPGGQRLGSYSFNGVGGLGIWWSSSEKLPSSAWWRNLLFNSDEAMRGYSQKENGFSVRCVRD